MERKEGKPEEKNFNISGSGAFSKRCDDVFSCLQSLESKHEEFQKCLPADTDNKLLKTDPEDNLINKSDDDVKAFQRKRKWSSEQKDWAPRHKTSHISSSVNKPHHDRQAAESSDAGNQDHKFKRPFRGREYRPPHRRQTVPDFKKNPQNWKRYSLEDTDDISESSNKKAAFAFLEERRRLREEKEGSIAEKADVETSACSKGLVTFKKPTKSSKLQKSKEIKDNSEQTKSQDCEDNYKDEDVEEKNLDHNISSVQFSKKSKRNKQIRVRHLDEDEIE